MDRAILLKEYRARLPLRVRVLIESSDEGLWATISTDDGRLSNCYTQAANATELVTMVNDAIQTYFEIPEEFRREVGYYVPLSDKHLRIEDMFNQLVAIEKETNIQGGSETTLTLKEPELQVC